MLIDGNFDVILGCIWEVFVRHPKGLAPGGVGQGLLEVPSSESLHPLPVDGEAPCPA